MKRNQKPKNKDDYIVINKRILEDRVFLILFILFIVVFVYLMVRGLVNIHNEYGKELLEINPDKISSYRDDTLNVLYQVPGDTWEVAELDSIEDSDEGGLSVESIIANSVGGDGIFDIQEDVLAGEVLSSIFFNQQGVEGYRQFMSYTFKPDIGYDEDNYVEYCQASFERDITTLNTGSEDLSFKLLSTEKIDEKGVMLKSSVTTKVLGDEEDSEGEYVDFELYYTQYIQKIGVNLLTITFGSINEDDTVDVYLRYFANNVLNLNTMK